MMSLQTEYRLEKTCGSCPEQYDVFNGDEQVGYFRLRHGHFTARLGDASGDYIYSAEPQGDGQFLPEEREHYLQEACDAVKAALEGGMKPRIRVWPEGPFRNSWNESWKPQPKD